METIVNRRALGPVSRLEQHAHSLRSVVQLVQSTVGTYDLRVAAAVVVVGCQSNGEDTLDTGYAHRQGAWELAEVAHCKSAARLHVVEVERCGRAQDGHGSRTPPENSALRAAR